MLIRPRSASFVRTLPTVNGVLDSTHQRWLNLLRQEVSQKNADARFAKVCWVSQDAPTQQYRVSLKYRGPRKGDRYMTPKQFAYAVDVYVHRRLR